MFKKEKKERKRKDSWVPNQNTMQKKNVAHLKSNALYIYIYLYSIQNCIMASNQFLEKRTLLNSLMERERRRMAGGLGNVLIWNKQH